MPQNRWAQSRWGGATLIRRHKILTRSLLLLAFAAMPLVAARTVTAAVSAATMPADQALKLLLEGNQRFVAGKLEHPNQTPDRRAEVAKGQHPFASVLACSDSRTPPEIIFDRGLAGADWRAPQKFLSARGLVYFCRGRVAGTAADRVVIESLDYSVKH